MGFYLVCEEKRIWKDPATTDEWKNKNLKEIIFICKTFLNMISERKKNKLAIYRSDHLLAVQSLFALLKLKQYTENDIFIMLKHKNKKSMKRSTL